MAGITLDLKSRNDLKPLIERLKKSVRDAHVKVGVLGSGAARDVADGSPATNVEIAIYNEFGVPGRIPERSFLRATFAKKEPEYVGALAQLLTAVIEKDYDVRKGLDRLGLVVSADVRALIREGSGVPPPNALSTLKRKLDLTRPGSTGSARTLVDTGQLANSVAHEVVVGKGGGK